MVGTEFGRIELWNFKRGTLVASYTAHGEENDGISQIMEIKTKNSYIRDAMSQSFQDLRAFKILATSAHGSSKVKYWKYYPFPFNNDMVLQFDMKASMKRGITHMYENSST